MRLNRGWHCIIEQKKWATGWKIGLKDATDDRLADLLKLLGSSEHQAIETIETQLGQHLIRAYELPTEQARSDTTSFSVYHQPQESAEEDSLLNLGHSKDRRPDLLQYRQMLATLDPKAKAFVGGNSAWSRNGRIPLSSNLETAGRNYWTQKLFISR